jgi:hypothetical protein
MEVDRPRRVTRNGEKIVDAHFKRPRRVADPKVSDLSTLFCDLFESGFCDLFEIFLFESGIVVLFESNFLVWFLRKSRCF